MKMTIEMVESQRDKLLEAYNKALDWKAVADTGERIIAARDEQIQQLKIALSEMELHFRGYEDSDKYTKNLFASVRGLLK